MRDQLSRMFPRGKSEWLDTIAKLGPELASHYHWTDHDWRHAMAQVYAETSGLSLASMRENMRYTTASRIRAVFSYRLRLALERDKDLARDFRTVDGLARHLVGQPDLLADIVYGGREGTPYGQGHRYIGRGPTQVTHRNNYHAIHNAIRLQPRGARCPDLVDEPEALEQPEWGVRALFADWSIKKLSTWANADDIENVSSVLNTGRPNNVRSVNGLPARKQALARAVAVWPLDEPILARKAAEPEKIEAPATADPPLKRGDECEGVKRLQLMLEGLGFPVGDPDGVFGELTEDAVATCQRKHGLPITGEADKRTMDVIERTAPRELPRNGMSEDDLARRGSRTYDEAKQLTWWGRAAKWLGFGTGGAGATEAIAPGTVTKLLDTAPAAANALTSPAMLRLAAIGFGIGLLVIGWRMTSGGKRIIGYRLEDARTGKHIGR